MTEIFIVFAFAIALYIFISWCVKKEVEILRNGAKIADDFNKEMKNKRK